MAVNAKDASLQRFIAGVLENGSDTSAKRYYHDDPTCMGFTLMFDFEGTASPLFNESDHGESAIRYLESIDEGDRNKWDENDYAIFREVGGRAAYLKRFKERLRDIVKFYPYYFTDIVGLGDIYNFNEKNGYEFERLLTIKTLESIDVRMGGMIDDFMRATFDHEFRRMMLPANMLEFRMYIIVSEIRNFRTFVNTTLSGNDALRQREMGLVGIANQPILTNINENLSAYVFVFDTCKFNFSDSGITTGQLYINHKLNFLDLFTSSIPNDDQSNYRSTVSGQRNDSQFNRTVSDFLNTPIGKTLGNNIDLAQDLFTRERDQFLQVNDPKVAGSRIANQAVVNAINSRIQQVLLGNVFSRLNEFRGAEINSDASKFITDFLIKRQQNPNAPFTQQDINIFNILQTGIKSTLGSLDVGMPSDFTRVQLGNVFNFEKAPFSTTLETFIKSALSGIITKG
jgi:hypothetical protein